jgi:hypothetical protein
MLEFARARIFGSTFETLTRYPELLQNRDAAMYHRELIQATDMLISSQLV